MRCEPAVAYMLIVRTMSFLNNTRHHFLFTIFCNHCCRSIAHAFVCCINIMLGDCFLLMLRKNLICYSVVECLEFSNVCFSVGAAGPCTSV